MVKNGSIFIGRREFDVRMRDNKTAMLTDAHNRANERAQQNRRRRRPPVQGATRLSNTDSIGRAKRIRQRLRAKIGEIMSSNIDENVKRTLARTVQMQLDRVEGTIRQIRRRERAQREEQRERNEVRQREEDRRTERLREERRRRRQNEMRPRSIRVRRDFLYSARQGGFDPYNNHLSVNQAPAAGPAVSFSIGGQTGVVAGPPPPPAGDVDVLM